jgi:hypothetical protein
MVTVWRPGEFEETASGEVFHYAEFPSMTTWTVEFQRAYIEARSREWRAAGTAAVFGQGLQQLGVVVACAAGVVALKSGASRAPHAV